MLKKIMGILMAVCIVFTVAACGGDGSGSGENGESVSDSNAKWKNLTDASQITFDNKTLVYMGNEGTEDWLQKAINKFSDMGGSVEWINAVWDQRQQQLATRVTTQDSPDLYKYQPNAGDWPNVILKGQVQEVESLIDYNSPLLKHLMPLYNSLKVSGKAYMMPINIYPFRSLVYYNKKIFEDNGLETPHQLFLKNQWTMEKMMQYAKELTSIKDGNTESFGMYCIDEGPFVAATGKDFVDYDANGKLINTIMDPAISKAMERVRQMFYSDKSLTFDVNTARDMMIKGKVAMWVGPAWESDSFKILTNAGSVEFVPFPKDPDADKWYIDASFNAEFLPKGAKNPDAAAAWVVNYAQMNNDPAYIKEENTTFATQRKMPAEFGDLYHSMVSSDKFVPVFLKNRNLLDFYTKFQTEFWDSLMAGESWSAIAERLSPAINDEIRKFDAFK